MEGWQAVDLLRRCGGQLRLGPGGLVGLDFTAVLAMGDALGYDGRMLAEFLPALEEGAVMAAAVRAGADADAVTGGDQYGLGDDD